MVRVCFNSACVAFRWSSLHPAAAVETIRFTWIRILLLRPVGGPLSPASKTLIIQNSLYYPWGVWVLRYRMGGLLAQAF